MKVALNTSPLGSAHQARGIGSYTRNLLEYLQKNPGIAVKEFTAFNEIQDVDIIHYPYFDIFKNTIPFNNKFPTVVTIHDLTPLIFPSQYPPGIRGRIKYQLQKKELQSVAAIITDSEYSKKDIVKYLKINPDKIFPVYLAPSKNFRIINDKILLNQVKKKYKLPEKFILYVGDVNYNKNIINIIKACKAVGLSLVMCGKQAIEIENLLSKNKNFNGVKDIIRFLIGKPHPELAHFEEVLKLLNNNSAILRLGFVPTEDLAVVFNLSQCLLLPSFYEGFGLPILEAQACGCPVVTSNVSSMPEVAGKGALLVNPENIDEISQAILKIVNDQSARNRLIKMGLKNVKNFSWEKTATETISVYEQVIRHTI